jgi:HTH-type transcriptional regulator, competence development regulator
MSIHGQELMPEPTFGSRLKELRLQRGLTQRQLSEQAGVDFTYLSKIENDRLDYTPSIKTLQALASALHVDELTIMEWADKVPSALQSFAGNAEAMRFLRRAADSVRSQADWRELNRLLDSHRKRRK